jgi:tetratricopeptide (TPR) repeat protein
MGLGEGALVDIAEGFLKENKVDLAVSVYEVYLNKLAETSQDSSITTRKMLDLAEKFRHQGWQEGKDPFFAERIYEKINALYGPKAFDDISQYNRAYNSERIKEYGLCLQEYLELVDNFPQYKEKDRVYFRIAMINAYIFGKADEAKKYLQKIVDEFPNSQDYYNSLYHLALLDQWYNNLDAAKEKYQLILDKTKDYTEKPEIVKMAQARLQEITDQKQIDYNLKTFLEAVLDEKQRENRQHLQLDLFVTNAKGRLNDNVKFTTSSYLMDTGCLQQDFSYLWSGNLGSNQNPFNSYEFDTSYNDDVGTKVVNVVLVGQSGIEGGTIEMADIYQK